MAKRPGVITFIGVIMLIQATLNIVAGIMLLALNTQQRLIDETNLTSSELITAGIVALVVGAIILLVTLALLAGSRVARVLVTIVQVLAVASAAWGMFAHHTGAWLFSGLLHVGIAIFVLWALYNEKADEYYAKS